MALQCGIVGLPNVGKSTLFNCLSNAKAQAANFPFCTIEPNVGVITVPDERLVKLAEIDNPKKVVPTTIEIVDIAGLVKGASKGEGLGNKFLGNIRNTNAIIHVLRCFDNGNITHVDGTIDPVRDKGIIDTELPLKDLETVESRIGKCQKQAVAGDKSAKRLFEILTRYKEAHGAGLERPHRGAGEGGPQADGRFESAHRQARALRVQRRRSERRFGQRPYRGRSRGHRRRACRDVDRGRIGRGRHRRVGELRLLIKSAYKLLDLQTFFTTGADESRAWTFVRGMKAPQTAGIIHTDFERGFIRAEVIKYDDYVALGSEKACRDVGKIGIEGKEYVVQDGDIMHFLFNV